MRVRASTIAAILLPAAIWSCTLIPGTVVASGVGSADLAQHKASLYFVKGSRRISSSRLEEVRAFSALVLMPASDCFLQRFSRAADGFEARIRDGYSSTKPSWPPLEDGELTFLEITIDLWKKAVRVGHDTYDLRTGNLMLIRLDNTCSVASSEQLTIQATEPAANADILAVFKTAYPSDEQIQGLQE